MGLNLLNLFQPPNSDKPLGGRYKIISQLGAGGFGQTFLAADLHLPGHPQCVVKQLKPQVSDAKSLETARRLFDIEAQVLYQLGNHDQIPRLLAHFEDDQEFYLAQELIEGEPLSRELAGGVPWSEGQVIALLEDLLHVLAFVHQQNVIHRDIKPSNLIRRRKDGRIVLIDFGAVKQVSTQLVNPQSGHTKTISIGTQGYTPKEQLGGNPRFSSDVYAVGMLGIQTLTGVHPRRLTEDPQTGEISWHNRVARVSPELAAILDKMVRYDFRDRYPTAQEAFSTVQGLQIAIAQSKPSPQEFSESTAVMPNQELQAPPTVIGSAGSGTDLSATPIWEPTQPSVQPQPSAEATKSGTDVSATPIWEPTDPPVQPHLSAAPTKSGTDVSATPIWEPTAPPVQPQPTNRNTEPRQPLATAQHSQSSGNSAPTIITSGSNQKQPVKLWLLLGLLLAGGASFLIATPLRSPRLATQSADRIGEPAPSPSASSAETPSSSPSPTRLSSPIASPSASPAQKLALPSSTSSSSPIPSPSASPVTKSAPPSPASSPTVIQGSSDPAPPKTKPAPARQEPPAAKPASSRQEPPAAKPAPARQEPPAAKPASSRQEPPAAKPTPAPQEPSVSEVLSQADRLRETGQYQKAAELYDQVTARKQDIPEAYWGRCYSLNALQQPAEAIASCNKALALKQNYPEALWSKGNALDQQQRPADSLPLYEQATNLKPDFAEAWNNQGVALVALKRYDEGVAAFDKATSNKPNFAEAWANRGAALWALERKQEAIDSLNKALQIDPNNPTAKNLLEQAQQMRQQRRQMRRQG